MARVMAVSFERYGRLYYLDPGEHDYTRRRPGPGADRLRAQRWRSASGRPNGSMRMDFPSCRCALA